MDSETKIAQLQKLADAAPGDHLTWFMLGRELLHADRYDESADAFARCCELKSDYTAAWRYRGDALRKGGRHAEALAVYDRGLKISEETGDLQAGKEIKVFVEKLKREANENGASGE